MAELSGVKDTWNVIAVKPKYHTYVVVIGESARRDALRGFLVGTGTTRPFASSVNGNLFTDYVAASGSTQKITGPDAQSGGRWQTAVPG
ncbi:Putative phosphoethanolamine transferase ybiP [Kluyvera cryocrescens]|uniref:Phosphoethanolamine transferase ybiP n=1 Tax=Kluyvera cryocrescens TaxID=580 RepID=A0A485ARQ5_KLUCR|nr:Putative phosphoethanolamine transferase ybiP [Kluyvera cryocrescens]